MGSGADKNMKSLKGKAQKTGGLVLSADGNKAQTTGEGDLGSLSALWEPLRA